MAERAAETSSRLGTRVARYVAGTLVICALAGVIGETFFPVQLIGDTGENDFEGVAFMIWSLCAFMLGPTLWPSAPPRSRTSGPQVPQA